jgi:pyrroloquinoline quinone biosynthesis protein D
VASVSPDAVPRIARLYRFQWEPAQDAFVLLFPEGMVKLNETAGEILRRCNDRDTTAEIVADLEQAFDSDDLTADVQAFLAEATDSGWIEWRTAGAHP